MCYSRWTVEDFATFFPVVFRATFGDPSPFPAGALRGLVFCALPGTDLRAIFGGI